MYSNKCREIWLPLGFLCLIWILLFQKSMANQTSSAQVANLYKWFDGIETWEPTKELIQDLPAYISGVDYDDRLIFVIEMGRWNLSKLVLSNDAEVKRNPARRSQKLVYNTLKDLIQRRLNGEEEDEIILIADFGGLRNSDLLIPDVNAVTAVLLEALRITRPNLYDKATILGTTQEKIIATLRSGIPKTSLPPWYGGSKSFKPFKIL